MEPVFIIAILIMSIVVHEVSHGFMALYLGDPTAKLAGRLTMNPIKHIDILGSIIVPVIGYISGGIIVGWAKPVPFNPYNLTSKKMGGGSCCYSWAPIQYFACFSIFYCYKTCYS